MTSDKFITIVLEGAATVVGIGAAIIFVELVRAIRTHVKMRRDWLFFEDSEGRLRPKKKIK